MTVRHESQIAQAGFTMIPNAVVLDDRLSIGAKLTYGYLKHLAWKDNAEKVEPPLQTLCKDLSVTEKTMRGYLHELVDAGLVETRRRGLGKSNEYTIKEPREDLPDREGETPIQDSEDVPVPSLASSKTLEPREPLRGARKKDPVWDALEAVAGFKPRTPSERQDFGRTVSELRPVLADAEDPEVEMRRRRDAFEERWPRAQFTHRVFRTKWDDLCTGTDEAESRRRLAEEVFAGEG